MLDRIEYINHVGESAVFGDGTNYFVGYSDARDYEWEYTLIGKKIKNITRSLSKTTLPILIRGEDKYERARLKNRLYEICEKDVLTGQPGKLYINDYYLKCYVLKSSQSSYLESDSVLKTSLEVVSDYPHWVKETKYQFLKDSFAAPNSGQNLDYPFDYPFDYASDRWSRTVLNEGVGEGNFLLTFYGACVNPVIWIDDHAYQVNVTLTERERVEVDSRSRKITLINYNGKESNAFKYRGTGDTSPFVKIPPGNNIVNKEGSFGVDIVLFNERSEPAW